ncbi:ABC transporter [Streptomyces marispadix]|uniref:ABC transporter n=1 Tax=Streptomyces marispadix TaxID=2922868 RepID=A0ABS9T2B9_9ACTN|nr:ABC transporter [Streptomyces marispadix]MCH6162670.1 ABC transporter [Streptomyces marispadix]
MTTTTTPHTGGQASAASTAHTARRARGPRLSGLTWLVWRQHRAAFWTAIAATGATVAWFAYQRTNMLAFLDRVGWPHPASSDWESGFQIYNSRLSDTASALGLLLPVLAGVLLGAPLIAADLEQGTGRLVNSQAVSRGRWIATKLGMAVLVVAVCSTALSAAFGWWLGPAREADKILYWVAGGVTGPVPVALTLLTLVGGVAIGMILRRTLLSMVVAFGFSVTVPAIWALNWLKFGDTRTATTSDGVRDLPRLPDAAYDLDRYYLTASGRLLDQSACTGRTRKTIDACLDSKDVVGWSVKYLPTSELTPMLWTGAAVMFALAAAIAVFVCCWGRRRLY